MPDNIEYIESYFQQTLAEEEKKIFEERCVNDTAFAKEVAFYITTRQALRETLLTQKQQQWQQQDIEEKDDETPVIAMSRKTTLMKWVMYAAAACLLLIASVFLFEAQTSTKRLASQYIKNNIDWGQSMDASHDSLQLGIAAQNQGDYNKAISYFEGVANRDPLNSDAKKYAGLSYLTTGNYDQALQQFDNLANMQGLQYNPGDFWKATTLLMRDKPGDKEAARALLEKVVRENESEYETAAEWLKKF